MELVLFDPPQREALFPFTATRPWAAIRTGIGALAQTWEIIFNQSASYLTAAYLHQKYPAPVSQDCLFINAALLPDAATAQAIQYLPPETALCFGNTLLALRTQQAQLYQPLIHITNEFDAINQTALLAAIDHPSVTILSRPWHLFQHNDAAIRFSFELYTRGRVSQPLSSTNQCINPSQIFLEEGAKAEHCILNAATGPIYIGRNAELMEGCLVRGPLAVCEGAVLKMGTKIYGATTVGPYSSVGGEIKNTIFFGYSGKGHDGYLGDAVIGEWCNLGAGTSCSNLKNNAGPVQVWSEAARQYEYAGLKCGLLMGDYSRCAINTAFNTGAVVGVCSNIFAAALTPKYNRSFSWGDTPYEFDKVLRDVDNWMQLKGRQMSRQEQDILRFLYEREMGEGEGD
jgi:UDP-N-acetylglucosamine diphosphorylase/glucosamine-1-phosphate N-acetyltransferase